MANQFLSLGLFIMLLAFFIVLNALSTFEDRKTGSVMNSLATVFSLEPVQNDVAPNFIEDPQASIREGDVLDRLDALFRAQIAGVEAQKNRLGTVMHMRITVDEFEKILGSALDFDPASGRIEDATFLQVLASVLDTQDDVPYRMDILLNIQENPAIMHNELPEKSAALIEKVASYAARLQKAGLPQKLVTTGLQKGPENRIDLYFQKYAPFSPIAQKEKEVEGADDDV